MHYILYTLNRRAGPSSSSRGQVRMCMHITLPNKGTSRERTHNKATQLSIIDSDIIKALWLLISVSDEIGRTPELKGRKLK